MIANALSNATNPLLSGSALTVDPAIKGSFGFSNTRLPSPSVPFTFDMLPSSYTSSGRQSAFVESPAQRRARVVFINQQQGASTGNDQRVQSWVKSQSSYTVSSPRMATPPSNKPSVARSKGHSRNRHSISSADDLKEHLHLGADKKPEKGHSYSPRTSPTALHYPALHLSSIPEDEPYVFYSTPITMPFVQSQPRSSTATEDALHTSRGTVKRHQRHLSDLMSIQEE
ncbi:hypothetical protein V5O48_007511 [Marasmius crinis-equi]|uniref:Uncharacterized protein n=1 Tax=Marasmius crinis-equi TaxID=585013 RepID=A0ABR3FGX7_9AGAR